MSAVFRPGAASSAATCAFLMLLAGCEAPLGGSSGSAKKSDDRPPGGSSMRAVRPAGGPAASHAGRAILTINSESFTADEVLKPARRELLEAASRYTPEDYDRYVAQSVIQLVRDRLVDVVLYQKAGLRLSTQEEEAIAAMADAELRQRVAAEGGGTQHEYEKALLERGTTLQEERERIRRQIVVQRYLQLNILPKVPEPTRTQLLALFESRRDEFGQPERRRMSLIEVRILNHLPEGVAAPTRDQQEEARRTARHIADRAHDQLRSGRDFADVARELSEGVAAQDGGQWGWVGRDTVRPRWQPAVERLYTLGAGELSEVLPTDEGFFIVRCDEIQLAVEPQFEALQPQLVEAFRTDAYNVQIGKLIEELVRQARIDPPNIQDFVEAVIAAAPPHPSRSAAP